MEVGRVGDNHYLEYTDTYRGVQFVVLFNSGGYRTAYVDISHTFLENLDYFECDDYVDVHCGCTFKDCRLPFEPQVSTEYTWLGWDYAHCCDGIDCETAMKLFGEVRHSYLSMLVGHVYTLQEVIVECKNVIDQIKEGEKQ